MTKQSLNIKNEESNSTKIARAIAFGEQVVISNFANTQKNLEKNIHIDESDVEFLNNINKSK